RVAYFTMEIALDKDIHTYSGGLGILAGDTLRSAADLDIPLIVVTLASRAGYFYQQINQNGWQQEQPEFWEPAKFAQPLEAKVCVTIESRPVWVGGWLYIYEGHMGGLLPVLLLDTDFDENNYADRELTHYLYGGDVVYRLKQEIVLGVAGVRMLRALGYTIFQYHMNEGHSALLGVELLRSKALPKEVLRVGESPYEVPEVRELCNFTTHTPIEAGHDRFDYGLVNRLLGDYIDINELKKFAGNDCLNMTQLALNLSEYVNGVAKRHAEVSRTMFPGYNISSITNGVHPFTWTSDPFKKIYDSHIPGWCHEPELLVRAECCIEDIDIWNAHQAAKETFLNKIKTLTDMQLDLEKPILGFARRMTAYKRPDLLFNDLNRLKKIAHNFPFQLVFAGKAHPKDNDGKNLIQLIYSIKQELEGSIPIVFLPNYDMALAQVMIAGTDVWLNTPLPPLEASGTSGMKATFNGVPNLSV
ncbi:MAG: alpha-glucan family phosphorylase, partial [Gammaproteobacteria bacterium]